MRLLAQRTSRSGSARMLDRVERNSVAPSFQRTQWAEWPGRLGCCPFANNQSSEQTLLTSRQARYRFEWRSSGDRSMKLTRTLHLAGCQLAHLPSIEFVRLHL